MTRQLPRRIVQLLVLAFVLGAPLWGLYWVDRYHQEQYAGSKASQDVVPAWLEPAFRGVDRVAGSPDDVRGAQKQVSGSPWSLDVSGIALSDPLALLSTAAAGGGVTAAFILSVLWLVAASVLLGRVFCGYLCPVHLLLEGVERLRELISRLFGVRLHDVQFRHRTKYLVLAAGLVLTAVAGVQLLPLIYPPRVLAQEVFMAAFYGALGWGIWLLGFIVVFEILVSRRWWCRYICPGGALWSLLGRFRLVRIHKDADTCDRCGDCIGACPFGLNPMVEDPGQECDNCGLCRRACAQHFDHRANALGVRVALRWSTEGYEE